MRVVVPLCMRFAKFDKKIGRQWQDGIGKCARTEMTLLGYVPPEGVIGYDFFANFTLVVDSVGGKVAFVKN